MPIRALIFDFDGLILDTEVPSLRSWQEVFDEHGVSLAVEVFSELVGTVGRPDVLEHLEGLVGRSLERELIQTRRRARSLEMIKLERPRPGVVRWLDEARQLGLSLAVASSSPREWIEEHLTDHGLYDRFDCIRGRDDPDVERPKPAPDVYLAATAALGVEPTEALAIEDSAHGLAAAKAAGLQCLVVPNDVTRILRFEQADLVITSLADLTIPEVLARLPSR
jgi:HAD superfamily hydrolase (TIGR01509 family)